MTTLTDAIATYLLRALAFPTAFWLLAYLIPQIYMSCLRPIPNLKKRYNNATWALVTGSGSGIGKALAFKLASQGLNVVLVSLDDEHLKNTVAQLKKQYPQLEFRAVGCVFNPGSNYLEQIDKATRDITIQCIFNNAGFIPTPFAASYAATKAFVSQLACSLHIEVKYLGIDVCAVHPSPVASNFYEKVRVSMLLIECCTFNSYVFQNQRTLSCESHIGGSQD